MGVSKTVYSTYVTMTGTLAEVAGALATEIIPAHKIVGFGYDSDNSVYFAVYHK